MQPHDIHLHTLTLPSTLLVLHTLQQLCTHTHTSFSIYFRWSIINSILSLSMTTLGIAWTIVGGKGTTGIGGIYSIMSFHWKKWQPLAWSIRLNTKSRTQPQSKLRHVCISKDAYQKVGALVEHTVKVLLCSSSVPVGEDMVIWALRHDFCLRGDRGREREMEWMTTFVWSHSRKVWQ
jgi:hypothetical protein